ncbi:MAG TPA: stalk domain-containing protein [Pseudobacteroides sp.]|nr:stalk domain-containing protein [Pseudobacteroides sp.]
MPNRFGKFKLGLSLVSIIVSLFCSFFIINTYALADNSLKNANVIKVVVDGEELKLDVAPSIVSGRTLVPLRAIFESLGAEVKWNAKTQTVTGIKDGITVELTINKKNAFINGKVTSIDAPAMIINGRTLVPARFVAESLGTDVEWDSKNKLVIVTTPKVINFPDSNLEAVIRSKINKPVGDILNIDVKKITNLDASEKDIKSIEGIEYLSSVMELNLAYNKISDIKKLSELKNLYYLYIPYNLISDINDLKGLTSLKVLMLQGNQIKDISPLSGLTDLERLELRQNEIFDISPIKNLKKLEVLNLMSNPITDISVLKSMSSIKKLYLIDSDGDDLNKIFEKYDQLSRKVNEIVNTVIKPEMTEYEKELAFHDYLVANIRYDQENFVKDTLPDESHHPYGALIKGVAVCDGYARSFQILLNAVGIECIMVVGDFESLNGTLASVNPDVGNWKHAWNIVRINNAYYHVDVTADDPVSDYEDLISHQFFNISDKQMGVDHSWDRDAYPQCTEDSKFFDLSARERKNTVITEDKYYYISPNGGIESKNHDGSNIFKIARDKAYQIVMMGDYIYYINMDDNNTLYKVKTDGTSKTKLSNTGVYEIDTDNNSIYYISDYKIHKVGSEGEGKIQLNHDDAVSWIFIEGNDLLYKVFNFDRGARLKKTDLNNLNSVDIISDEPAGFIVSNNNTNVDFWYAHNEHILDGWIYFVNKSDLNSIYKVKIDGTEKIKISDDFVEDSNDIEILGDYIYYKNYKDGNRYYRIKVNGENRQAF